MSAITLEERIIQKLMGRGLTVATAESCTGGLISSLLTNVSGSSAVFMGGVICYSNQSKQQLLGVDTSAIENLGAVSASVAEQMATGIRQLLHTDLAIAITGIAGPTGGTESKPVGTAFIAISSDQRTFSVQINCQGDRQQVKMQFAQQALACFGEVI